MNYSSRDENPPTHITLLIKNRMIDKTTHFINMNKAFRSGSTQYRIDQLRAFKNYG